MCEVRTHSELTRALMQNVPVIHVADQGLALHIMKDRRLCRHVMMATQVQGYRLRTVRCLGQFDVSFVKKHKN